VLLIYSRVLRARFHCISSKADPSLQASSAQPRQSSVKYGGKTKISFLQAMEY
jgi:hypothetical protein